MKIYLASPRGFCAGVDRAIDIVELSLKAYGAPIYVRHEIVHNRTVVEDLRAKGAVFVEDLDAVPTGATVIFSAHGVSPQVRQEAIDRKLRTIDATCPLVTKVHFEAIRFARQGCTIVLIGHEGHDEVIGTLGEAPEATRLVSTVEDVDQLTIRDLRLMLGLENLLPENRSAFMECGLVFDRSFAWQDSTEDTPLDSTWMLRAGISF